MKIKWNYENIINLEYFRQLDEEVGQNELHLRDRELYLEHIEEKIQGNKVSSSALILHWLRARIKWDTNLFSLPGERIILSLSFIRLLCIILPLFAGAGSGLLFLNYSGATPVNVLNFLVIFIFTQQILALVLLTRGTISRFEFTQAHQSPLIMLLVGLSYRFANFTQKHGLAKLPADKRLNLQAMLGNLKMFGKTYSRLIYWSLMKYLQLAGMVFNAALLTSIALKLTTSDIAFGWQSTLQFSGETLHGFIRWLALPWSWLLGEGVGYPSLVEIEGSRIILKEGIGNLATPDLISWYPFLLLCVLVYGLLFRLLLYIFCLYKEGKLAASLDFNSPDMRKLLWRMQTPLFSSQADPEKQPEQHKTAIRQPIQQSAVQPLEEVTALLPDEIYEQLPDSDLSQILSREGLELKETLPFMAGYDEDRQLLKNLTEKKWQDNQGIVIIVEAWMPPLTGFVTFLQELRKLLGDTVIIRVRMVGKPQQDSTVLESVVDKSSEEIWRKKIKSLGDNYLEIDCFTK